MITGPDPQAKGLVGIVAQHLGVVGINSIQRLGLEADLIIAIIGYALGKGMDRAIGSFVLVCADHLVERHPLVLVGLAMHLVNLGLLTKAVGETPRLNGRLFEGAHGFANGPIRRIQIALHEKSGRDQRVSDVVQVLADLVPRKPGAGVENGGVQV